MEEETFNRLRRLDFDSSFNKLSEILRTKNYSSIEDLEAKFFIETGWTAEEYSTRMQSRLDQLDDELTIRRLENKLKQLANQKETKWNTQKPII